MESTSFTAKIFDIESNEYIVILHENDVKKLALTVNNRVEVQKGNKTVIARIHVTRSLVNPGEIGVYKGAADIIDAKEGSKILIDPLAPSPAYQYIRERLMGKKLGKDEIFTIIRDIANQRLSALEIAAFLLSEYANPMTMEEIEWYTRAMAETGTVIKFNRVAVDKHSIGGVPGNKVSLLIVPIVAAAGLLIPKTSSKAITSPSGTANTMGVLANVEFSADELKRIVNKTNGAIVWGGKLNLAPPDSIIISKVARPLSIDPVGEMLASIMGKKLATGIKYLVMDLPMGPGTKLASMAEAQQLGNMFLELGRRLGMTVVCGVTYGGQPVGHAVGPALEAKEALQAFKTLLPSSLVEKSVHLAGLLLESVGQAPRGKGADMARDILKSGKAEAKFREIIEAQGGNPKITPDDIPLGTHVKDIIAEASGYVTAVDNKSIVKIAKAAGAPDDPGAGVYLFGKVGDRVERGKPILRIYGNSAVKVNEAFNIATREKPITIEGMLLRTISLSG